MGKNRMDATSDEIQQAISSLKELYDEQVIAFLAGLYDPETGGIYYSYSAQQTDGYLPDVESTAQTLLALDTFCPEGRTAGDYLPDGFGEKLVRWVQELEDAEDGYFYHPQWGKEVNSSRKGRDLGWSRGLLRRFGAQALYPTAIDRLTGTEESRQTLPTYLQSKEAFQEWLRALPWDVHPYSAGNSINAMAGQIEAAGFMKTTVDFLRSIHNPKTGLWGEGANYNTVSALMKVAGVYYSAGEEFEYLQEALQSCIDVALSPELSEKTQITFIYNPWCAINSLRQIAEQNGKLPQWFEEMLYGNAAEMIRMTKQKLAIYKKADGGFSYMPDHSSATSQGAPASLGTAEGDVNATTIAVNGVLRNLNQCLGLPHEAAYGEEAIKRFVSLLPQE